MAQQQTHMYEYIVNLVAIKMNVKFPCKMKLQLNGVSLTSEVPNNETNKFIFNQEITLKEETEKAYFQIQISLITEKGGRYIAGILRLQSMDLRSEGQGLNVPLTKCLDAQAYCEMRIDQIICSKVKKSRGEMRSGVGMNSPYRQVTQQEQQSALQQKKKVRINTEANKEGFQTKSQLHFPLSNKRPKHEWEDNKTKLNAAQSTFMRNQRVSPSKHDHLEVMSVVDRDKLIQAEVYKDGYNKLKDKYKKEAEVAKNQLNKRIALQNTENNLKLEIMRLKLRTEEQEKNICEKNNKMKELQTQVSNFQKKQLDLVYLKEEYSNKDHHIKILEENIRNLARDLEEHRTHANDRALRDAEKLKELKRELDTLKAHAENKQLELDRELRLKTESLKIKDSELLHKNETLNKDKRTIDTLEREAQAKIMDYDRTIQIERATSKAKIDELKARIDKSERERHQLETAKNNLTEELERAKALTLKMEYENKILLQEGEVQKKQLAEMRQYKDRYTEANRQLKLITDERSHLQKQLERALQNKQINLSELTRQHQDQIQYFKRTNKQLDDKQKILNTKILQLESHLEVAKGNQEKLKKTLETSNNQLTQTKQKEKNAKKLLKNKEQDIVTLESQIAALKQKTKTSQHFLKHQIEQLKEQLERVRADYQQQCMKNIKLSEDNSLLSVQLGKAKVKIQFMEERGQKDTLTINEGKRQIQTIIKQHQTQVNTLTEAINSLRTVQKQLISKMQKQQIQLLKTQDKLDRSVKQNKVFEERILSFETSIRQKNNESGNLNTIKLELQNKLQQLQSQLSTSKNEESHLQAERVKNLKVIQIIQDENSKIKKEAQNFKHSCSQKENQIDQMSLQIKRSKQDNAKLQMKLNNIVNDYQRFRQNTIQLLNNSFSQVFSDVKKYLGNSYNFDQISLIKKSNQTTISDVNNLIVTLSKDSKLAINKIGEQFKQIQRENERILEELTSSINKGQTVEYDLNRQIKQLQQEIANSYSERDQDNISFDEKFKGLNYKIRQKDKDINILTEQLQQVSFSLSTLQLQFQAQTDQNNKKNIQIKRNIQELQERIIFLTSQNNSLEGKLLQLQGEKQKLISQINEEKENSFRILRNLTQTSDKNQSNEKGLQQFKKNKKQLLEKIAQLQIRLNNEKDKLEKSNTLLQQQESKGIQLKNFISNLMKQKQQIIKLQLQKGQIIIKLEASITQLTREKEQSIEENNRMKKINQQSKETNKKLFNQIKQLQIKNTQEKNKYQKLNQKLKEKEKDIVNRDESIEKLQEKYNRINQKTTKQINQLREEVDTKNTQAIQLTQQFSQKALVYQKQKKILESSIVSLQSKMISLQQQLFNSKQKNETNIYNLETVNSQTQQLRVRVQQLEVDIQAMLEELREKDQVSYQMQGKIYQLQIKLDAKEKQKIERINISDNDWTYRYDGMCEQYEQRIQLVEKQREYFKFRLQTQQEQYKKLLTDKNNMQTDQQRLRKSLEEKIVKLQDQRLQLATQKNSQIQKLVEQINQTNESIKNKQFELRKVTQQLEIARNTINKIDSKSKENQDKIKTLNKNYQFQIQQFKKKQATYQSLKQAITDMQWTAQRQVRKVLQNYIKKSLQVCQQSKAHQKMMDTVRNLQQTVVDAMKFNVDEAK